MKNKEIAIKALEAAPGLGAITVWTAGICTEPNCAIGWLYVGLPEEAKGDSVYSSVEEFFGINWSFIARENDGFEGTEVERRDYMINLFKELSE